MDYKACATSKCCCCSNARKPGMVWNRTRVEQRAWMIYRDAVDAQTARPLITRKSVRRDPAISQMLLG